MLDRTTRPGHTDYANYGGRGIRVCERWLKFENFAADLVAEFRPELELDRIDVDGPYSPENCRWATRIQQQRNRRNNHVVTWNGQTLTVQEWAERHGLNPNTVVHRLRRGWPVERALTEGTVLLEIANAPVEAGRGGGG